MKERKQKTLAKRLLVAMLSVMMTVTFIPTSLLAFAAEPEATPDDVQNGAQTEVVQDEAQTEDVQTDATKPAKEEIVKEETKPAASEPKKETKQDEPKKASTKHFTKELEEAFVDVEVEDGAFDEDVSLKVDPIAEGSKEYKKAEEALAENKQTYSGMLAFDIHFENSKGKEVEPNGTVSVKMTAKEKALKNIAPDAFNADSVKVTHIGEKATEVVADTIDKNKIDGTVDVKTSKKAVEKIDAEFEVKDFSVFTLTWGDPANSAKIIWGYKEDGQFKELEKGSTVTLDTTQPTVSLEDSFEGYLYHDAVYCAPGQDITQGINIEESLNKSANGAWQYVTEPTEAAPNPVTGTIENGSTIYVTYYKPGEPNPSGASDTDVPSPTTTKTINDNHDGTYDITLDIKGATITEDNSHYANVLIVLDATRSMNGAKWTNAKAAMNTLIETLSEGDNAANAGKIDYALVTFGRSATVVQNWTKNNAAFKTTCAGINMVTTSGTNWEAGMRGALYGVLNNYPAGESAEKHDPTYVIFLTDGDPNVYYSSGAATNYTNTGTTNGYNQNANTSADHSADEAKAIAAATKLYGIYCGDSGQTPSGESFNRLANVITGQDQGGQKAIAANANTIQSEFKAIAETISSEMNPSNVSADDGVTELSGISANVSSKPGGYTYYRSTDGGETFSKWAEAPGATYSSDNGVTWDLSEVGNVKKNDVFRITFTVWPSQEAFDLIANLNNGTVEWDSLEESVQNQINRTGSEGNYTYSLKTNTHLKTSYTFNNINYTDNVNNFPSANMSLVSDTINIFKHWEDDINTRNRADYVEFYLLIDGEYYQKDGTTAATKENAELLTTYAAGEITLADGTTKTTAGADAWKDSEYIAPGLATLSGKTVTAIEDGHSFTLEEKAGYKWERDDSGNLVNKYQNYSMEFAAQTVRPMVIYVNGARTVYYFVEVDTDHPAPSEDSIYTIISTDGTEKQYYIDNNASATITAENKKTPELDITKIIDEQNSVTDLTSAQLDKEEFTYTVTFTFPKGSDPSGVGYWRYEPYNSGWTLPEYDNQVDYQPDNYVNGDTFFGESATSIWGNGDSTDTSQGTLEKEVSVKLTRSEVLRFTNLPVGTTYTIVESKANGNSLESEGYVVDNINAGLTSGNTIAENEDVTINKSDSAVSGTVSESDTRYYHQFTNVIQATDVYLKGTKKLVGYNWSGETYTFNVSSTGTDTPMPPSTSEEFTAESGNADVEQDFGRIRFTKAGTYTYTINEVDDSGDDLSGKVINKITYGDAVTVTVTVEEKNGKLVVSEVEGADYTESTSTINATITNEFEKVNVNVEKKWNDNNDQYGYRPVSILITLIADGVDTAKTLTLNAANNWQGVFEGLDKYDANGNLIDYTINEIAVACYETAYAGSAEDGFTVTNTLKTTSLEVDKTWVNADGTEDWPEGVEVTIQLTAGGTAVEGKTATLDADNPSYTFESLPKYKEDGTTEIVYSVEEAEVAGYDSKVGTPANGKVTVTNTQKTTSLEVDKKWANADGTEDWPEGVEVTIQLTAGGTAVEGKTATLDADNPSYTFESLPKYKEDGTTEIVYSVEEAEVAGYDSKVGTPANGKVTVTNTQKTTELVVEKVWANVDGSDTWPEEVKTITVQLTADGKDVTGKTATLSADQTSYTFESLPKYKADGETEIVYGVKEVKVAGYESEVGTPVNVEDDGKVIGKKITITNTQEADLLLTKTVDAFFDHAGDGGDAVYPSFAFSVKGYAEIDENGEPVGEPILDTVVGVDFNNFASTKKERLITKLPQGVAVVVVEELDSGNYTSDPKKKTVTELEFDKDTQRYRFKVSFDNNLGENPPPPSYNSGVVNRYEKNSNGNYEHPKNSEQN